MHLALVADVHALAVFDLDKKQIINWAVRRLYCLRLLRLVLSIIIIIIIKHNNKQDRNCNR